MARSRAARPADVGEIARSLPEVTSELAWGDLPAFKVRGKAFIIYRGPRPDAVDAAGEMIDDVIVISCAADDKQAIISDDSPFFSTAHFDGYHSVLLRESEIGGISKAELTEVITDAWLARAPKRLAQTWLAEQTDPAP